MSTIAQKKTRQRRPAKPFHTDLADCIYHGIALDPYNLPQQPYEQLEIDAVRRVLRKGMTVILAGYGKGYLALNCATIVGPEYVHPYEAEPFLVRSAGDDVRLWSHAIKPRPYALTVRRPGDDPPAPEVLHRRFFRHPSWASASLIVPGDAETIEVEALDINEEIAEVGANALVLDVEGAELEIFQALDLTPLKAVVVEIHEGMFNQLGYKDYEPTGRIVTLCGEAGLTRGKLIRNHAWKVSVLGASRG